MSGAYLVCVAPNTFSAQQFAGMERATDLWAEEMSAQGHYLSFQLVESDPNSPDCAMTITAGYTGPGIALASSTQGGQGAGVALSNSLLSNNDQNRWAEVMGHEFGHIIGLRNVDDDYCHGKTIMHRSTMTGDLPTHLSCSDLWGIGEVYGYTWYGGGEEPRPSEYEEDCWDYYIVTHYYAANPDGSYRYLGSVERYIGTTCEPIEDGNDEAIQPSLDVCPSPRSTIALE